MKPVTLFKMESCPHCQRAFAWMKEAFAQNPRLRDVPLKIIDEVEEPELANRYDYYYVPTYYIGDEKVHEGVASLEIIQKVFTDALNG